MRPSGHAVAVLLLLCAPALAQPGKAPGPKPTPYANDRYALAVMGPAGWTKELEGPRSRGSWIDLVSFREPKTKAYLMVSCQASADTSFDQMAKRLAAHYKGLSDIQLNSEPERRPGITNVRGPGLHLDFNHMSGKTALRSFMAFYLNGRFTVRLYGTVGERQFKKVEQSFLAFQTSLRFTARSGGVEMPNFVHEGAGCSLIFPEGWTVRLPLKGPLVEFTGERLGASIWVYRTGAKGGLEVYRSRRRTALEREGAASLEAPPPRAHEKRGDQIVVFEYDRGAGEDRRHYREVCLAQGDVIVRVVLGARATTFPRVLPALEKMVESLRIR
jgi:hypothetical protein